MPLRYFSMFSGIGGFELGIDQAINGRAKAQCVGYSEIDKYAVKVYERQFRHENFGDATTIDPARIPDFDLLVGGFPCQAFSVAGKRAGFEDSRGTLFFEVARILTNKHPRHFILENVKGLLSHDGGQTFAHILEILTDMGYCVEWQVLNSKYFGVPQNRERVYIVGHLGIECPRTVFPIQESTVKARFNTGADESLGVINRGSFKSTDRTALTITANYHKGHDNHGQRPVVRQIGQIYQNKHNSQAGRIYDEHGLSPTLDIAAGGNRQPKIIAMRGRTDGDGYSQRLEERPDQNTNTLTSVAKDNLVLQIKANTRQGSVSATVGDAINYSQPNSKTRRGRVGRGVANTLETSLTQGVVTEDIRIRRLTPVECERLQGFPDDWTSEGLDGVTLEAISDTQRYKMCGNAVTVNVVTEVVGRLFDACIDARSRR